ncbi:MAG: homogentisate 1,2-dioxygenase [Deltaproteobacteria bacterium]|nr:homogentisate 1,2-dioxygenase [Deltaproteobacteria bacterium]
MIERLLLGTVADKPHIVLKDAHGKLLFEECFTRRGFDSSYTIVYHSHAPMPDEGYAPTQRGWPKPAATEASHARRLFHAEKTTRTGKALDARTVLLTNAQIDIGVVRPTEDDDAYLANNDGDDVYFLLHGSAECETPFGTLSLKQHDYLWIPRSLPHRFLRVEKDAHWLHLEMKRGMHLPRQYLNELGQLKMDAPYSHRDFRRPTWLPKSTDKATVVIKRDGRFWERKTAAPLLDVVGLDGFVYPLVFPIHRFQPKTGLVHLPPTIHATFAGEGALVCSFVPRLTDTHPNAIPCPYPHSSVDCDEMIFYCSGNFTSRRGVGPGAISLHPAGVPHGPHPGAYEASIGTKSTEELAVMVDTFLPLHPTQEALAVEQADYHGTWK